MNFVAVNAVLASNKGRRRPSPNLSGSTEPRSERSRPQTELAQRFVQDSPPPSPRQARPQTQHRQLWPCPPSPHLRHQHQLPQFPRPPLAQTTSQAGTRVAESSITTSSYRATSPHHTSLRQRDNRQAQRLVAWRRRQQQQQQQQQQQPHPKTNSRWSRASARWTRHRTSPAHYQAASSMTGWTSTRWSPPSRRNKGTAFGRCWKRARVGGYDKLNVDSQSPVLTSQRVAATQKGRRPNDGPSTTALFVSVCWLLFLLLPPFASAHAVTEDRAGAEGTHGVEDSLVTCATA